MEKYTMFMDWKNQYSENEYTSQSNLQIQCNPYQATSHIFHRTRTKNFKICMEIQKTSNSQSNLEKEEWNWRNQLAWLQALLPFILKLEYICHFIHTHTHHTMTLNTPTLECKLDDRKELVSIVLPLSVKNIAVLHVAYKY